MLRIPHCLDKRLTDSGKVVSPTHPPHFAPQKHYYFYVSGTQYALGKILSTSIGTEIFHSKQLGQSHGDKTACERQYLLSILVIRKMIASNDKGGKKNFLFS
jgi:hypothetical protein